MGGIGVCVAVPLFWPMGEDAVADGLITAVSNRQWKNGRLHQFILQVGEDQPKVKEIGNSIGFSGLSGVQ